MDSEDKSNPQKAQGRFYVSRIRFRGFKSFKSADVQMQQGFVALAGPNGSGKSNVTDAIRFALGEMSLKALRAKKVTELINMSSAKAEVTLFISGEKNFEIRRAIREDGKTSYSLDGRHLTRTQVLEALRPYGIEAGSHNIIAQGHVQKIAEMNPKERRGIIDSAAGISEFDEKKKEALSELGKVDARISDARIMLSERRAYLEELGKERDAALASMEASKNLSRARATMVHAEYEKLDRHFNELIKKKKEGGEELAKIEGEAKGYDTKRAELEGKRKAIADKVGANKEREKLLSQIETVKVQSAQEGVRAEEAAGRIAREEKELSGAAEEQKRIKKALLDMEGEDRARLEELKKMRFELEEKRKKLGISEDGADEKKGGVGELAERISKLSSEKAALAASAEKGGQITGMIKQRIEAAKEGLTALPDDGEDDGRAGKYLETAKSIGRDLDKLFENEKELNRKLPGLDRELLEKKEALAALRGSVSPAAQNPALLFVMGLKKDGESGIFGPVSDLLGVEEKYRVAVEASAAARLTYVVVDCMDTAARIIAKLKENRAGRCTFIPLDRDITEVESAGASKAGLGRLSDYVTYERKFYPAVSYVLGDTVLVSGMAEAKKIGVGRYRMVSLEGEVIERAGIVTGGSLRGSIMARANLLKIESEAEELKKLRDNTFAELYEVREQMQKLRRERAEAEIKARSLEAEMGGAAERAKRKASLLEEEKKAKEELAAAEAEIANAGKRVAAIENDIAALQKSLDEGRRKEKEEAEKRKKVSSDAQSKYTELFEKCANLESTLNGRKREREMLNGQLSELVAKCTLGEKGLKDARKAAADLEASKKKLDGEREKLEGTLNEISASVEKLYTQMKALQEELEALGAVHGKLNAARDAREREQNDLAVKIASAETKLADLKAEWEKHAGVELLELPRAELEELAKTSESRLASLGNVNMKAPEAYEQKKKELDEIDGKIGTLESEKAAVMHLIDEIETKKRNIFMKTFQVVNTHFQKLFGMVFRGEGMLILDEPSNPLESGLSFRVRGEHDKKDRYLNSMSGGEQTLLSMMFIFALQMHKPAPFYILDEVEAALDKENSHKMADFVRQMSRNAQFIVVTHNDNVLSAADVALGVMKTEDGSKIVGVQLEGALSLAKGTTPPAPPAEAKAETQEPAQTVQKAEVRVKKKK